MSPAAALGAHDNAGAHGFSHPTYLQIFLTASLPIMGLAYALVGGLKLSLVDRLQIDEGKVGRLVGGFGTMFGPTILLCGFLTDAVGRKGVWLAGSAAVAVSILMLARTRTYRGALVAVVLLGIGWAAQVNVSNVLMRVAVPADRRANNSCGRRISSTSPSDLARSSRRWCWRRSCDGSGTRKDSCCWRCSPRRLGC